MSKSAQHQTSKTNELSVLFDESIIPQGLIQAELLGDGLLSLSISQSNKIFNKIASIKPATQLLSIELSFKFLNDFNPHSIKQFYLSNKTNVTEFICESENKTYKLSLKKISKETILFTLEDITDFQEISAELNEKKRQLKETQEISQLGYWIENHGSKEHFWSEQIYKILNEKPEKTRPSFDNYLNLVYDNDKKNVEDTFRSAIKTKTGYEITHRLRLKNGTIKYVVQRCYTNYDYRGNPVQSVGIIQDITTSEIIKEELKNSEAIFKSVFNYAPLAIVLIDNNYKPLLCNTQFADILGYDMTEILEKDLKDITHPDDYKNNKSQYIKLFKGESSSFSITKRYIRKDSTTIWTKVIVSAIKNKKGQIDTAIAMVQDISSEKKATEALTTSEYRYRTLIENANDGIGLFDLNFKPIIYNTVLYKMLGYSQDEYLKFDHNKFELFHTDDIQIAKDAILNLKQNRQTRIESRMRNRDGKFIYFSVTYIPVEHNNKPAILIFRRNISKRKQAEQQNEEYRLFLETIMENLPVSLFAKTTPDLKYLYWNKTTEEVTGISADDAIGKTDFELIQLKQIAEQYQNEDKKLLKNGAKIESEYEFTNTLGETKQFKTIKALHKTNTGNPLILGISMDVSKLKEAEKQIEQSTDMLKEAQKIAKLGYWEYDVKKDLFFDNPENRQILGTENLPYFINSQQFKELFHKDDQDMVAHAFKRCVVSKIPSNGIVRVKTKSDIKHISINYRPLINTKGKVEKLRGTCLDITHIRNSEIKLNQTTKQILEIQNIAQIGFIEILKETNSIKFSNTLMQIIENDESSKVNSIEEFNKYIHPDDRDTIIKTVNKSISENHSYNIQYRLRLKNDRIKFVNEIYSVNSEVQSNNITRIIQDITAIKEQEIVINKISEVQVTTLLGSWEYNLNDKYYYLNKTLRELLKVPHSKINYDEFIKFIHIDDRYSVDKVIKKAILTHENFTLTYRLILNNGDVKYVQDYSTFHKSTLGDTILYGMIRDITEYRTEINKSHDTAELYKAITENLFIGIVIYQDGKRIFANQKWSEILGVDSASLSSNMNIDNIYKPESTQFMNKLFAEWEKYKLTEYTNKVTLHPIHAPKFTVEINVKEIIINNRSAFLVLANPE